jgi:hypothetical protein
MRGTQAREIDGLVVGQSYDRFTIAPPTKRMHAVQAMEPSTSSLTRGGGAWAALASHPPSDMRGTYREIDGLVVRVKVMIDLRSRHSTKRMHACRAMESFTSID